MPGLIRRKAAWALVAASLAASCGSTAPPQFSARHLVPPASLNALSCSSSAQCVAVGDEGRADVTVDGGRVWHVVQTSSSQTLASVACPAVGSCIAVGKGGVIVTTSDGGANWTTVNVKRHLVAENLTGVACANPKTCLAVGALGLMIRSTDGGAHWSLVSSFPAQFTGVSCFGALCAAVTLRADLNSSGSVFTSNTQGAIWYANEIDSFKNLFGVQCTSARSCTAVGDQGAVDATNDRGFSWIASDLPDLGSVNSVTCLRATPCLVGGAFGSIYRWRGGTRWTEVAGGSAPSVTHEVILGISCPTASRCWAAGDQGAIEWSRDGGKSWTLQLNSAGSNEPRVLLIGDSVAQSFGMFIPTIESNYGLYVMDQGILGCGIAEGEPVRAGGITYNKVAPPCDGQSADPQWPVYWAQFVSQFQPSIAVLLAGFWEVADRTYQGQWTDILQPAYQSYIKSQLDEAVQILSSHGAKVVLLTCPYFATGPYPEDDPARVDAYNELVRQVASEHTGAVTVIDLNAFADPGGSYSSTVNGVDIRASDGEHFSQAGSILVAKWLLPQLAAMAVPH